MKRIVFAITLFFVAFCVVALLERPVVVRQGEPMAEPKVIQAEPFRKTVMGHVMGHELTADSLKLQICSNDLCYNLVVTRRTEVIITNLQGLREVYHEYKSMAEVLDKHKNCDAAVGIEDGQVVMCIIYLIK